MLLELVPVFSTDVFNELSLGEALMTLIEQLLVFLTDDRVSLVWDLLFVQDAGDSAAIIATG